MNAIGSKLFASFRELALEMPWKFPLQFFLLDVSALKKEPCICSVESKKEHART